MALEILAVIFATTVVVKAVYVLIVVLRHGKESIEAMKTPLTEAEVDEMNEYGF